MSASYNDANQSITLSVCIPTYNRSALVAETLRAFISDHSSLCEADQKAVEIIVRDNASPDNTFQALRQCAGTLPFVHIHRNEENIGGDMNIATIPELARGEYVWVCGDDDDDYKPGVLKAILDRIRQHHPAMIFLNHRQLQTKDELVSPACVDYDKPDYYEDGRQAMVDISRVASIGPILFISAEVYRKDILMDVTAKRLKTRPIDSAFPLYISLATACRGPVCVIKDLYMDNVYGNIGWADRANEIFLVEMPKTIKCMKAMGYTTEQYKSVYNPYMTDWRKNDRFYYLFRTRYPHLYKLRVTLGQIARRIWN